MTVQNLPNKGDRLYLMHKAVIVTDVYIIARLVKIHYVRESIEFFVDASAVTTNPDYSNSIALEIVNRR